MIILKQQREYELQAAAHKLGLSFQPEDSWGLLNLLRDFKLFRSGHSKKAINIMEHRDPWHQFHLRIFDYHYTRGAGKHRRRFAQTVFFVESKQLGLPNFWMSPEGFFERIGTFLGMQDINFVDFPDFSRNYLLRGDDEEYIRARMSPELLHFFSIEKNWCLEGCNYFFVFYRRNKRFSGKEIAYLHERGTALHQLLLGEPPPEAPQ